MKIDKIWLALIVALAASFAAPLRAQEEACKADVEKFCKNVEPGEGGIMRCLKEHEAELSAPCKAAGEEMKAGKEAMKEACKSDFDTFCKGIEPGEGRLIKCIKEHEAKLSPKCKAVMAKEKEKMMAHNPCAVDEEKFCKDAKGQDRRACMAEHEKDLSAACTANIAKRKEKMMENHPCAADMEKFCKDAPAGQGGKIKCLISHEAEVSAGCKARMAEDKAKMMEKNPCGADIEKFCKDIKPGEGRIMKCLKEHTAELSEACKAGAEKMKQGGKEGGKEGNKEGQRGKKGGNGGPKGPPPEGGPGAEKAGSGN
jgi:hypothetical protein